jgi:hypothetical protein
MMTKMHQLKIKIYILHQQSKLNNWKVFSKLNHQQKKNKINQSHILAYHHSHENRYCK